jgi:hypothetical protein
VFAGVSDPSRHVVHQIEIISLAGADRSMELMHAKLSITIARSDQSDWATP